MVHDATSDEVFKVFILLDIASHVVRCWKRTIHCHAMVDSSLQRPAHCTNRFGFIHVDPIPYEISAQQRLRQLGITLGESGVGIARSLETPFG
jgi:hypothetical protein